MFESALRELQTADDWRAHKAAFEMVIDWNEWLADVGEQHREPAKSQVDVDMRERKLAYTVVREDAAASLPTTDGETLDYDSLGFTSAPASVEGHASEGDPDE